MKKEWNKKTNEGWIGGQYNHKSGSSIERIESCFDLYLHENNARLTLSKKQLIVLREMLEEFFKEELK